MLIGQHAVGAGQLMQAAGRLRTIADLDRLATSLVGSSHLVALAFQLCLTDKVLVTELFHVLSPLRQGDGLELDLSEAARNRPSRTSPVLGPAGKPSIASCMRADLLTPHVPARLAWPPS